MGGSDPDEKAKDGKEGDRDREEEDDDDDKEEFISPSSTSLLFLLCRRRESILLPLIDLLFLRNSFIFLSNSISLALFSKCVTEASLS